MRPTGSRALRREAEALLRAGDPEDRLRALLRVRPGRLIGPLLSFLCSADDLLRWRAVRGLGLAASRLAEEDLESAREVMRRLAWSLADESGAMGWGAPEAMAEIMFHHRGLATEFAHVLVSYVGEGGTRPDGDLLLPGVLWGLGRLGSAWPDLLEGCPGHLDLYLRSGEAPLRGLAAWALARMGALTPERAEPLLDDDAEFSLNLDGELVTRRVRDVAASPGGTP
jgi:hypothetical protein